MNVKCKYCEKILIKDEIALCKKLLGKDTDKLLCITCLADWLDCLEDDLMVKIQEFKEQGCTLFN